MRIYLFEVESWLYHNTLNSLWEKLQHATPSDTQVSGFGPNKSKSPFHTDRERLSFSFEQCDYCVK